MVALFISDEIALVLAMWMNHTFTSDGGSVWLVVEGRTGNRWRTGDTYFFGIIL